MLYFFLHYTVFNVQSSGTACRYFSAPCSLYGGDNEIRTHDPLLARQVLSQLSYIPTPSLCLYGQRKLNSANTLLINSFLSIFFFLRKEVIQPHLPIRLPCYDFTPIIYPTFGDVPLSVRLSTSGVADSHGVTGGVYKARERIHRGMLIRDY